VDEVAFWNGGEAAPGEGRWLADRAKAGAAQQPQGQGGYAKPEQQGQKMDKQHYLDAYLTTLFMVHACGTHLKNPYTTASSHKSLRGCCVGRCNRRPGIART